MNAVVAPWIGQTVGAGRYEVQRMLGGGGMADVLLALDRKLHTPVVLKVPRPELLDDPTMEERFQREMLAIAKLRHPGIVKIIDLDEAEGIPFAVLEYLAGGSLDDHLPRDGAGRYLPSGPQSLAVWLPTIARALDFVHGQGFLHRDVKPGNILFDADGNAYLSDFGIVSVFDRGLARSEAKTLTPSGELVGTPEFMAPELILGTPRDGRADQYALVLTAYFVLCGRPPFEGGAVPVLARHVKDGVPPLSETLAYAPPALVDVIARGAAKEAKDRFESCTAFAEATLEAIRSTAGRCPACGKELALTDASFGAIRCESCSADLIVGLGQLVGLSRRGTATLGMGDTRSLHAAETASAPRRARRARDTTTRNRPSTVWRALLATGGILTLAGLATGLTLGTRVSLRSARVEPPKTQADVPVPREDVLPSEPPSLDDIQGMPDSVSAEPASVTGPLAPAARGLASLAQEETSEAAPDSSGPADGVPPELAPDQPDDSDAARPESELSASAEVALPEEELVHNVADGPRDAQGEAAAPIDEGGGDDSVAERLTPAEASPTENDLDPGVAEKLGQLDSDGLALFPKAEADPEVIAKQEGPAQPPHPKPLDRASESDSQTAGGELVLRPQESERQGTVVAETEEGPAIQATSQTGTVPKLRPSDRLLADAKRFEKPIDVPKGPPAPPLLISPFDEAEAHIARTAWAEHLRVPPEKTNSVELRLILVPPGEFRMGSPETETGRSLDETPHLVRLRQAFYAGVHEVTNGQFSAFVHASGYETDAERAGAPGGWGWNETQRKLEGPSPDYSWRETGFLASLDYPVSNVTWNDAVAFCEWLTETDGHSYRLLTEAEWEYCCRAGTTTRFHSGDDPSAIVRAANVADATLRMKLGAFPSVASSDGHVFTGPVGRYLPNAFGLHDTHGNVWEWCRDRYDATFYERSPLESPELTGPDNGAYRVFRGGSWFDPPDRCRAAKRYRYAPTYCSSILGFRVACGVDDLDKAGAE